MVVVTERKDGTRRVQLFFNRDEDKDRGPSRNRVKSEFLNETKISTIMERANRSGMVRVKAGARFGDFTSGQDYLQLQNRIIAVQKHFDSLPSEDRNFFANDPKNFLDFITDPKHRKQAIEMGFIEDPEAVPEIGRAHV